MSVEKQIEELEDLCRRMMLVYGGERGKNRDYLMDALRAATGE